VNMLEAANELAKTSQKKTASGLRAARNSGPGPVDRAARSASLRVSGRMTWARGAAARPSQHPRHVEGHPHPQRSQQAADGRAQSEAGGEGGPLEGHGLAPVLLAGDVGDIGVYAWWVWRETRSTAWVILAGAFAGLAAGTKYTGLVWVALAGTPVLVQALRDRDPLLPVWFGLACAAGFAPMYIRNMYYTGNPVWPFLPQLFGHGP